MRQWMLDAYAAWINWCFDNPWIFVLGFVAYGAALWCQHKAGPRRRRWRS